MTEFGPVKSALWIGTPDSPDETLIYLFSSAITCQELGQAGWDGRIDPEAQMFELMAKGTAAGSFPAGAMAEINHTFIKSGVETSASSGVLTVTALTAGKSAAGSFEATFTKPGTSTTSAMNATFTATFCPDGKEP